MSLEALVEHPQYFLSDGDTVILVENILFCVHAYFLRRESELFARLLAFGGDLRLNSYHQVPGNEIDSSVKIEQFGEEHARVILDREEIETQYVKRGFKIEGYTSTALANLLWMFYGSEYNFTPQSSNATPEIATHRWLSILTSSVLFTMPKFRRIACQALSTSGISENVGPVLKAQLGRVYRLERSWYKDAWVTLCTQEDSVGLADAIRLGITDLTRLMRAREKVVQRRDEHGTSIDEAWLMELLFPLAEERLLKAPSYCSGDKKKKQKKK